MAGGAGAAFTEHADRVRVVHHHGGTILLGEAADFRQLNDVAFHAEHAVHHDEFAGLGIDVPEAIFQRGHVIVPEPHELALAELAAFHNAGVIAFVGQNVFPFAYQRADDAEVDLETRAVEEHRFLFDEPGERLFQFKVNLQRPVQEPRTGAARAVFLDRGFGRLLDFRMIRQSEVTVRAEHQHLLAFDGDFAVLGGGNGAKIWIQAEGADFGCGPVVSDFVEHRQRQESASRAERPFPVVDDIIRWSRGKRRPGCHKRLLP